MHCIVRRLLCLLVAPALALSACTEHDAPLSTAPAAPAFASAAAPTAGAPDFARLAKFRTRQSRGSTSARAKIGPEGGRLEFEGFAIQVPAGAVSRSTTFSIRLPGGPQAEERVVAEFGPHNTRFARPVTLEFPRAGTSLEGSAAAAVLWWDPAAGDWVDVGGSPSTDGSTLRAQTGHFSIFGIGERRGVIVTGAGG